MRSPFRLTVGDLGTRLGTELIFTTSARANPEYLCFLIAEFQARNNTEKFLVNRPSHFLCPLDLAPFELP